MNKAINACTSVVVLILATFSFGALAQNPVVVIPMAGDEYFLEYIWVPAADAEVSLSDTGLAHSASAAGGTNCIRQDVSGITQIDVNLPLHFSIPRNRNLTSQAAQIY